MHWDSRVTGDCNFFQFRRAARTPFPITQLINPTSEIRSRYRRVHPFGARYTMGYTIDHIRCWLIGIYLPCLYEIKSDEKHKFTLQWRSRVDCLTIDACMTSSIVVSLLVFGVQTFPQNYRLRVSYFDMFS